MIARHGIGAAAFAFLGVFGADAAIAESPDCFPFGSGLDNLGPDVDVPLGKVNDLSPRVRFVKLGVLQKGCPNSSAVCQDKAYLVPGDEVVVTGSSGEFVCVSYADRKGRTTYGWFPRAAVTRVEDPGAVRKGDWIGEWRSGPESTIRIAPGARPDAFRIEGDATWGALDPGRVERGGVHIGTLEGETQAEGANLSFGMGENGTLPFDEADDVDCKVQMRRLGSYLLVKDNGMCGGANVTFTGLYRRK